MDRKNLIPLLAMPLLLLAVEIGALVLFFPVQASGITAFEDPESMANPVIFIAILLVFTAFLLVPGLRNANRPPTQAPLSVPAGESGWLDPTEYPPARGYEIPALDPKAVLFVNDYPNPDSMGHLDGDVAVIKMLQEKYLKEIRERFNVPLVQIPLLPGEIKGLPMLAELGEQIYGTEKVTA